MLMSRRVLMVLGPGWWFHKMCGGFELRMVVRDMLSWLGMQNIVSVTCCEHSGNPMRGSLVQKLGLALNRDT
eukprot:13681227-Alexandrium_andersonii.AAC.1